MHGLFKRRTSGCPGEIVPIYPTKDGKKRNEVSLNRTEAIFFDVLPNPFRCGDYMRLILVGRWSHFGWMRVQIDARVEGRKNRHNLRTTNESKGLKRCDV